MIGRRQALTAGAIALAAALLLLHLGALLAGVWAAGLRHHEF